MKSQSVEPPINDLVDFYNCWPELRTSAVKLTKNSTLADKDVDILDWMIRVVDRVGPVDLERES